MEFTEENFGTQRSDQRSDELMEPSVEMEPGQFFGIGQDLNNVRGHNRGVSMPGSFGGVNMDASIESKETELRSRDRRDLSHGDGSEPLVDPRTMENRVDMRGENRYEPRRGTKTEKKGKLKKELKRDQKRDIRKVSQQPGYVDKYGVIEETYKEDILSNPKSREQSKQSATRGRFKKSKTVS